MPQLCGNYMDLLPPESYETYCRVFIGHTGSFTAIHQDFLDTSITAVKGTKRVILFPPDSMGLLQKQFPALKTKEHKNDFVHFFFEPVLTNDDREKIMSVGGRVVFVQPGLTLYIPAGWYHQVSNLEDGTISLSNASVFHHNVLFFIQNEHPEQLNMSQLIECAIIDFDKRVRAWGPPVVTNLRKKNKILRIGLGCKSNNNYRENDTALNQLLRFLEEGQILNTAIETEIKSCVDEKKHIKVKVSRETKSKILASIGVVNGWLHNL